MSLYNLLHGVNPLAGIWLTMLDLKPDDVGRFRDCYLARDDETKELQIHIYTRNGGGNREDHWGVFDRLSNHPMYLRDWDDDFDSTYATIAFKIPDGFKSAVQELVKEQPESVPPSPQERFSAFMEKLQSGVDDPQVARVTTALKPVFERLQKQ